MAPLHRSYYQVLGVAPEATPQEIQSAYRRLARRYHPDLNRGYDARARFDELSDAYAVLHDPELRARYDRTRATRYNRARAATRSAPKRRSRAPAFTSRRPARPVPRFSDEDAPGSRRWGLTVGPLRVTAWWTFNR